MTNNRGLLPLKLGDARIIETHSKLIHIVNITDYELNIELIQQNIERIINQTENRIQYRPKFTILKQKLNILLNNLDLIKPRHRLKRGLINGLGSIVKTITGNMDHDDYMEINRNIDILRTNQNNLEHQMNNQISVNERMIQRFNDISDHVNNQQTILEEHINRFQNDIIDKLNNVEHTIKINQYFDLIFFDIEILNNHLEDILESINLAKLKIISKHILHPSEMHYILEKLNQQNVDIKINENIYELLELDAYFNHSNIIFVVKIPILYPESFSFYRLKQLPLNNTYTLELKSQYLLLSKYVYQYVEEPCIKVEQIRYCTKSKLQKNSPNGCIENIINNKPAHCSMIEEPIDDTIEPMEQNYLFIRTHTELIMDTTCNKNDQHKILKGTALIYFENCTININNMKYSSKYATFWDSIQVVSTLYNEINTTIKTTNLTLQKLNKWTTQNAEAINLLYLANNTNKVSLIGVISVIASGMLIIIILHFIRKYRQTGPEPELTPGPESESQDSQSPQNIQLSWSSLHS